MSSAQVKETAKSWLVKNVITLMVLIFSCVGAYFALQYETAANSADIRENMAFIKKCDKEFQQYVDETVKVDAQQSQDIEVIKTEVGHIKQDIQEVKQGQDRQEALILEVLKEVRKR